MKIVMKPIADIHPYEKNPRINDGAVQYVLESIQQFGFKNPIIIDKENVVVCGHTRLKAAEKLGLREVPCIIAADLTPEQIKAFRLVDNKTSDFAAWDVELLTAELAELSFEDLAFSMADFGFDVNGSADSGEDGSESRDERIKSNQEIDVDDYADEKFKHECPKCGFKFN